MAEGNERYSVTLVPPAANAVVELMAVTGLTKTDVINRAVQIWWFLEMQKNEHKEILLRNNEGAIEQVHIV